MPNLFVRAWRGEASLAAAFWLVYFVFSIILAILLVVIFKAINPLFMDMNLIKAIMLPYTIYGAICVWRCGKNSMILWNILSKIAVILGVLGGCYALLQYLQIA